MRYRERVRDIVTSRVIGSVTPTKRFEERAEQRTQVGPRHHRIDVPDGSPKGCRGDFRCVDSIVQIDFVVWPDVRPVTAGQRAIVVERNEF